MIENLDLNKVLKRMDDTANAIQDPDYYKKEVVRLREENKKLESRLSELEYRFENHMESHSNKD
jgi:BMFP domain-containing protein YqiC